MEIGNIKQVDIDSQMRDAFLDYAMSVIVARALPDARDGLKPVHRRILFAMHELGLRPNSSYKKSARIVGEVLGKYHPHGDSAVYESMARMAQNFSMRYMLVDGQGNFGSVDGDSPAAMRYTEARLHRIADEMLADIEKNTVNFGPNFDDSLQEPLVLPSRLPNLLLNGSTGIAVGMATNIPPHNLRELSGAIGYMIEHYDALEDISVEQLMEFVPGPDFPTGGAIVGREGILQMYSTGKGRLVMRGIAAIEEMKNGRQQINITEIPYQINKSTLIERIAELVREDKLDMISDLRDESDQRGMSIIIELKRNAQPKKVLNQLYKYTTLQSTFGAQILALVNGEPRTLTLKRSLHIFIEHRIEVITRRTQFDLDKARARAHILEGLLIALANLDDVIKTIRQAQDAEDAKLQLVTRFKLSELQAQAILDMQLRRLSALERWKIEEEAKQIHELITSLEDLLANPHKILALINAETQELSAKYGDDRRTRIAGDAKESFHEEDLVQDAGVLITLTQRGYIKRTNATAYKSQGVGGKGITGHTTREEDEVLFMFPARTLDTVLFFSDKGKVYSEKVYQIPDADRTGKGISIYNVLALGPGEKVTAALPVTTFTTSAYCILATTQGKIKRVNLEEFAAVRPSGLIAMGLENGDELGWARLTSGANEILLITEKGQALRFAETEVRAMGRSATGVMGIRLSKEDKVASMGVVEPEGSLLVVTRQGFGKQTPLKEYPARSRATGGVMTIDQKAISITGRIIAAPVVQPSDDVTLISSNGIILRLKVEQIKTASRGTRGVHLMRPQAGDSVAAVARIANADLQSVGVDGEPLPAEPQPGLL
ncbi:MAG: DNA gyrase subunit A [Anaerolineae bacterium CG_4_9_14_3_um_filter_57_17]|nr:DNA gyrase subunit A [bacterium]NCT20161.1 DNA gyrase subunit A [bacterium]OIO86882.1 MAG: DNA gyrase subunit A [Anaerolineae bacterium CG2_30_57_67]PJB67480.1 MAG: DNA gyrase subunit A [Anaerolineae bacterium CG_4_9_14_3_um_filter_57_17]